MFENVTVYDRSAAETATLLYIRKENRKGYLLRKWYFTILGVIGLVCGLLLLLVFRDLELGSRVICVLTLFVGTAAFLLGLFLRRLIVRGTMRKLKKQGDLRESRTRFEEDCFHGVRTDMETRYQYEVLKDVYETEGFFALLLNNQTVILLDKAGFTEGTPGGFRSFLEGRLGKPLEFVQ